jgi:hypothetical protein
MTHFMTQEIALPLRPAGFAAELAGGVIVVAMAMSLP